MGWPVEMMEFSGQVVGLLDRIKFRTLQDVCCRKRRNCEKEREEEE